MYDSSSYISEMILITALLLSCLAILVGLGTPGALGWHTIPLVIGTTALCADVLPWLTGRRPVLDARVLLGLVGIIYLLISPSLQIAWDYWPGVHSLTNAQGWLNVWAWCYAIGLIGYRLVLIQIEPKLALIKPLPIWSFEPKRLQLSMLGAMALCVLAQAYVLMHFGGIGGFVAARDLMVQLGADNYDPFAGLGVPMLLADSFRNLFAMAVILAVRGKAWSKKWWVLPAILVLCLCVFILFGGLRGSRGAIVYSLFFVTAMYHFLVKPLNRKFILAGFVGMLFFLTVYFWYKFAGIQGFQAMFSAELREELYDPYRADEMKFVIARDLGRMDLQTTAIKAYHEDTGLHFSWGRTYLAAPFAIVPSALVPEHKQPPSITKEKTNLLYGAGTYVHGAPRQTTLLLGQFGELWVNFGWLGVGMFFVGLTAIVVWLLKLQSLLPPGDIRWLIVPILLLLPIQWFMYDSPVLVMWLLRNLAMPLLVILYARKR